MWSLLTTLFIGFFVGLIARALHRGDDKLGFWLTAGLGIAGALFAEVTGRFLGFYEQGEQAGWIMSILGAVVILMLFNAIRRQRINGGL
jgi:uncharacterized membrane protein YeaQ/YmgE (transglycosylase-associated protein family)